MLRWSRCRPRGQMATVTGRVYYVGNTGARNEHAGIYIEAEMTDSHASYNTCLNNTRGITCRASQRGTHMHNLVIGGHAGLSVWNSKGGAHSQSRLCP